MSTVYLQVGQCGNQLGFQLWKHFQEEIPISANTVFNRYTQKARCVMVDSEPKVVERPFMTSAHPLNDVLNYEKVISSSSGRGNNWAMGFSDTSDSLAAQTLECLRREIEGCDYFQGTVMLHSVAGGTGSGLGSKIMSLIKEEYPVPFLLNISVFASFLGDTPLQDYNSILTLNYLQEFSDGLIYFENDKLLNLVQTSSNKGVNASTHNLNELIASALVSCLYPQRMKDLEFHSLLNLTPSDNFKFLECYAAPFLIDRKPSLSRETSWMQILDKNIKMFPKRDSRGEPEPMNLCVKSILKGNDVGAAIEKQKKSFFGKIYSAFKPTPWAGKDYIDIQTVPEKASVKHKIDRSIGIIANRTAIARTIKRLLVSAKNKFAARAYLHWFRKFGCEEAMFEHAFERLDSVVQEYTSAMKSGAQRANLINVADIMNNVLSPEQAVLPILNYLKN